MYVEFVGGVLDGIRTEFLGGKHICHPIITKDGWETDVYEYLEFSGDTILAVHVETIKTSDPRQKKVVHGR